jgi:hypothetical protein
MVKPVVRELNSLGTRPSSLKHVTARSFPAASPITFLVTNTKGTYNLPVRIIFTNM